MYDFTSVKLGQPVKVGHKRAGNVGTDATMRSKLFFLILSEGGLEAQKQN